MTDHDPPVGPILRLDLREDGVAVLWFDDPAEPVNVLKESLAGELEPILRTVRNTRGVKGLILISGKPDGFIAGADLHLLSGIESAAEATRLSRMLQSVHARIASLNLPTVAAIHGACLGGGLELALAFDARIATSADETVLGLPEVQVGVIPGGGGTQRLPRLIGLIPALDLLLTGRRVRAKQALALGLIDEVVAVKALLTAATEMISHLAREARPYRRRVLLRPVDSLWTSTGFVQVLTAYNPLGRRLVLSQARRRTVEKSRRNYPAPERLLDVVELGFADGIAAGYAAESDAFGELAITPQARALMQIFHATTELKKDSGVDDPGVEPLVISRLGILGGGLMGSGIAFVSAERAEVEVWVKERDADASATAIDRTGALLDARVRGGRMSRQVRDTVRARIDATEDLSKLRDCEIVIEAVFEDLALKRRMLSEVERLGPSSPIFATNTSSIPVAEIAAESAHPEKVIGMHYLSPVERMPLLEIVVTEETDPQVTATCAALGRRQGKTVIVVGDGPGFFTSRILAPYLNEATWLLMEGAPVGAVDEAFLDFGFPVGPIGLLDEIGIDVAAKVAGILHDAFGARMQPPPGLEGLLARSRRGRKSGRGFYQYAHGGQGRRLDVDESVYVALGVKPRVSVSSEMVERCVLQMVNESVRCLDDGILRNPRDGDIGAVFGLGFPPFLGGPFRFVDTRSPEQVVERLERFADQFGERFAPAPLLVALADIGGKFHDSKG